MGEAGKAGQKGEMVADKVFLSDAVFTGLTEKPYAAAIAVTGDRISAVRPLSGSQLADDWVVGGWGANNQVAAGWGANSRGEVGWAASGWSKTGRGATNRLDAICDLVGPRTEVIDCGNRLVMAGFHDAHIHFFHSALYASPLAEQFLGENEADCVARLAPLAARRPAGSWLLSQGWRDYRWNPAGKPSKASLDAAYADRPVAMYSGDAHTLWLNSNALARLGITEDSVPPAGGYYGRDAEGELTGIVGEVAAMELMPRIVGEFRHAELVDAYRLFQDRLNGWGVTGVCDVSLMAKPGMDFVRDDLYQELYKTDELSLRVSMFPTLLSEGDRYDELAARYHGPYLRVCGYKQFMDGVSSQHTAWLHDPYTNAHFDGDAGAPFMDPALMGSLVEVANKRGRAVRVHAIGDEAIHAMLDSYEEALRRCGPLPKGHYNTLEHLENFQEPDIARLAQLGVIASVQPRHMTLDPGGPERDLGPDRVPFMWPFARLLREGVTLAFGTDSPVTDANPLPVLYAALTRKDADTKLPCGGWLPDERLSLSQALRAYTVGSAQAAGRLHEMGTLEPGKFADVIVWDSNPFEIAEMKNSHKRTCDRADADLTALPEDLIQAQAEMVLTSSIIATLVGGRFVRRDEI